MNQMKRVESALTQLVLEQPFFATLALRLNTIETKDIPTFATDGKNLFINTDWCSELKNQEIGTILAHEVLHCFPAGTFVAGCDKFIENIHLSEKLIDHTGKIQNINLKSKRFYEGALCKIKARGLLPIEVTAEHPILTTKPEWKTKEFPRRTNIRQWNQPTWKKATEVQVGDWVMIPKIEGYIKNFILKFEYENEWSVKQELKNGVKLNTEIAEFLGLSVAAGWRAKNNDVHFTNTLSLHKNELEIALKLKNIIKSNFGLKCNIKKTKNSENCINLCFNSAVLGRF